MTEVAEAESLILERMPAWPPRAVAIADSIGRVLAEAVRAERDQPPFDRVTMDGIAISHADWAAGRRRFRVTGTQAAGTAALTLEKPGDCIRVMTGTPCPDGANTIIPVERLTVAGADVTVAADAAVASSQFVHPRGSDRHEGDVLLKPGVRLGPAEVAVLASAGKARVEVAERPRVAAVSTGDELVGIDESLEPFQIRSCNDFAIEASLRRTDLAQVTRASLKDDPEVMLAAIRRLHESHDVLILSGGVSMGQFDFVPAVLQSLGAEIVFHRINQKPGRPMWFGLSSNGKPVFALPGNPVSTLVCVTRYVLPALRRAAGLDAAPAERVRLTENVAAPASMTYFLPVKLEWTDEGVALAEPRPTNTSGDFISLAYTDGFVQLPPGPRVREAGTVARLFRWS
jgi:molybdopterin molybdotransferase